MHEDPTLLLATTRSFPSPQGRAKACSAEVSAPHAPGRAPSPRTIFRRRAAKLDRRMLRQEGRLALAFATPGTPCRLLGAFLCSDLLFIRRGQGQRAGIMP